MSEGDRVTLNVPKSRYDGRTGTVERIKIAQKGPRAKHGRRWYGVRVDGDEGTPWEGLPWFEEHEISSDSSESSAEARLDDSPES